MRGSALEPLAVLALIALIASTSSCLLEHDSSAAVDFCVSLFLATSGVVFAPIAPPPRV